MRRCVKIGTEERVINVLFLQIGAGEAHVGGSMWSQFVIKYLGCYKNEFIFNIIKFYLSFNFLKNKKYAPIAICHIILPIKT